MSAKRLDFALFLTFLLITSLGGILLRLLPSQNIIIVFISNTIGNIGGIIVASSLLIWYKGYDTLKPRLYVIFSVFVGFVAYEMIQLLLPWATFDFNDILGTLIGSFIALSINALTVLAFKKDD